MFVRRTSSGHVWFHLLQHVSGLLKSLMVSVDLVKIKATGYLNDPLLSRTKYTRLKRNLKSLKQPLHFILEFRAQYCCHPFNLKLKPSTSQPSHFREIFRNSSHHVNTNKGSVVKQSGNDVEGCRSEKVLFQPSMRVFLQYSVKVQELFTKVEGSKPSKFQRK